MIDEMPSMVADAKRVPGTVCVPCIDEKMALSLHHHSKPTTNKCKLVHTDVDVPPKVSLGGSVYFLTIMEDSTGFITARSTKTNCNLP